LLLVRGDHDLNEVKASKVDGLKAGVRQASDGETDNENRPLGQRSLELTAWRFATGTEIEDHFGCKPGYLGPVGLRKPVKVIVDRTVAAMSDFVCGANAADHHLTGVNWGRDLPEPDLVADLRNVLAGDPSPDGGGVLAIQRGIEVGHVFYLGTKYSKAMNATYLNENGKPQLMEMGCYGIGVTRILGAAIEQNHDARGIVWPVSIAPFAAVICPIGYDRSPEVKAAADALHDELDSAGIDVMLDDRGERPGAMFADWELIGVPQRVVISDRGLKAGTVELQGRREATATVAPLADAAALVKGRLAG
jgi:prolyl-tRNA synthetase